MRQRGRYRADLQFVDITRKTAHVGDARSHQEAVATQVQQRAERLMSDDLGRLSIAQHCQDTRIFSPDFVRMG